MNDMSSMNGGGRPFTYRSIKDHISLIMGMKLEKVGNLAKLGKRGLVSAFETSCLIHLAIVDFQARCPLQSPDNKTKFILLIKAMAFKINYDSSDNAQTIKSPFFGVPRSRHKEKKDYVFKKGGR